MARNFFKIYEGVSLVPRSADPTSPLEGDLQFSDGTARAAGLWQYLSGSWQQFGGGGSSLDIESQSSSFTAADGKTYLVNTGTAVVVTLPSPSSNAEISIKDSTGGANSNNITINTPGAETIDGAANLVLSSNYESVRLVSDGSNWFIL